jgi:hypothetical protein
MAIFDRGYYHFLSRDRSILFDACIGCPNEEVVPTKWLVYGPWSGDCCKSGAQRWSIQRSAPWPNWYSLCTNWWQGDMHNRKAITPMRLWESLTDYDLWPVSSHVTRRLKQTDSSTDLCTGLDCIYSTISSWDILNSHTPGAWLQPGETSSHLYYRPWDF